MSDNIPYFGSGEPKQVNLKQIAQNSMANIQRHFDMLAFNLAAHESVQEEAFNAQSKAPSVMPAANYHQNFEQMQAYSRDLLIRQVLGDCMNLAVNCMNNANFFLALVKATQGNSNIDSEAQALARKAQEAFLPVRIAEKFDRLKQNYGITCELQSSILSIDTLMQALIHHGGVIKEAQLNANGEVVFEFKAVKIIDQEVLGKKLRGKLVDVRKTFRQGESIVLSDVELQLTLVTIASFAESLFKSVSSYARSVKNIGES